MILYVNGDSHAAAAEAVNPHGFACDDSQYFYMGTAPHPDNLAVSWSRHLADALKMALHNHSQAGCSNDRIIRTTREFLTKFEPNKSNWVMIISWTTWERREWLYDGKWWQVGASGIDSVPEALQAQYKEFVINVDWKTETEHSHDKIWKFHEELEWHHIPHVFFNGDNDFSKIGQGARRDWGVSYINPYDPDWTYSGWLRRHGYDTVAPDSWHFGREAHAAWGRFVLEYIVRNKIIT